MDWKSGTQRTQKFTEDAENYRGVVPPHTLAASNVLRVTEDTEFKEDTEGAVILAARARRRRLPAKPEVIPGAPRPRPKKRSTGAPGIQPVLSERTPLPFSVPSGRFPCLP